MAERHTKLDPARYYALGAAALAPWATRFHMRPLTAATPILAATALLGAPASAHHSQSMFDTSQEILVKGTVARFDWVNPHMYLIVETEGPDGKPALVSKTRRISRGRPH